MVRRSLGFQAGSGIQPHSGPPAGFPFPNSVLPFIHGISSLARASAVEVIAPAMYNEKSEGSSHVRSPRENVDLN